MLFYFFGIYKVNFPFFFNISFKIFENVKNSKHLISNNKEFMVCSKIFKKIENSTYKKSFFTIKIISFF